MAEEAEVFVLRRYEKVLGTYLSLEAAQHAVDPREDAEAPFDMHQLKNAKWENNGDRNGDFWTLGSAYSISGYLEIGE